MKEKLIINARVSATIAYMESPRGISAWTRNRDTFDYTHEMNTFASIQTATKLRRYEAIMDVYCAIGPALNARNCGRVA